MSVPSDFWNKDKLSHRFWARVLIGDDCWEWTGRTQKQKGGYGHVCVAPHGRVMQTHRFAYIDKVGPIPFGLCVCHKCDNPRCVRPGHLFLGTVRENAIDMVRKGRRRDNSGELNGMAKLTAVEVDDIRRAALAGVPRKALAKRYGVAYTTLGPIIRGEHWQKPPLSD